jgi:hypothetical protein
MRAIPVVPYMQAYSKIWDHQELVSIWHFYPTSLIIYALVISLKIWVWSSNRSWERHQQMEWTSKHVSLLDAMILLQEERQCTHDNMQKLYGAMAYVGMQPSLMSISSVASSHKSMCYGVIDRDGWLFCCCTKIEDLSWDIRANQTNSIWKQHSWERLMQSHTILIWQIVPIYVLHANASSWSKQSKTM